MFRHISVITCTVKRAKTKKKESKRFATINRDGILVTRFNESKRAFYNHLQPQVFSPLCLDVGVQDWKGVGIIMI